MSTAALVEALADRGIEGVVVCHDAGTAQERTNLQQATGGRTHFMPLYWWNRKIRAALWKRPLIELRQLARTGGPSRSAHRVASLAERWQVDLIHSSTIVTPEGGLAARLLRLPHVWHVRELVGPSAPFRLPLVGPALGTFLVQHCSLVLANSPATAAMLAPWLPADWLEVVPNGIRVERFAALPLRANQPTIVAMVGSLTSRVKKHHLFIAAAARVPRELDVEFRIYGHDPSHGGARRGDAYVAALHRSAAQLGVADRLKWPGFIADPVTIMGQIDLLVHPAEGESFGRVVVEAMAAGLPVVAVRGGGVGQIVVHGQTGLLADVDSSQQLAEHIARLVRDPALRRQLGEAGRLRARAEYSLDACADRVAAAYRRAMSRPVGAVAAMSVANRAPGYLDSAAP